MAPMTATRRRPDGDDSAFGSAGRRWPGSSRRSPELDPVGVGSGVEVGVTLTARTLANAPSGTLVEGLVPTKYRAAGLADDHRDSNEVSSVAWRSAIGGVSDGQLPATGGCCTGTS